MHKTKKPWEVNILFLGGAKRVSVGRKIIEAGRELGLKVNIFSYELSREVPIAAIGTVIVGMKWKDRDLLSNIHACVLKHDIDIILPFVDPAIEVAGMYADRYTDAWAPVVAPSLAATLFDKDASAKFYESHLLPIPATYRGGRPTFPLIAKPRHGSASKGIMIVRDVADFRRVLRMPDYMMERFVEHHKEYTVDAYISQSGEILCVSPRLRVEVLGGEVTRSVTIDYPELHDLATRVISETSLRGPVTLQFILDTDTNELMLMEINPRLGGGVVCSIHAGADIPMLILKDFLGLPIEKITEVKPGVLICRYFDETVFNV
ncbi:MAG: ATP-grasp domain-containing protein [Muribaculaceae bacterium]|nr:ATP-grasp domain-containing protein [Muribaculaceae bacterium]